MRKLLFITITIFLSTFSISNAAEVEVPVNQAKLEINGAVCAFCAYGMQKGLSKKSFIDKTQGHKGVESDIENQIITLYLKEGHSVNLKEVYDSIKKSGYEPRTFHLRVEGSSVRDGNKMFLTNKDNERLFELVGERVNSLKDKVTYDLQLLIDEESLIALTKNQVPVAQIYKIIKGE